MKEDMILKCEDIAKIKNKVEKTKAILDFKRIPTNKRIIKVIGITMVSTLTNDSGTN
jgi:hypothetical protein